MGKIPSLLVLDAWSLQAYTKYAVAVSNNSHVHSASFMLPLRFSEMGHSEPGQLSGKTAQATSMP